MSTLIAAGSGVDTVGVAFPGVIFSLGAAVQVGDVVAIGAMTFPTDGGSPYPWTCVETLGNVCTERPYQAGPGAFKELHVWTVKVTIPGTLEFTIKRTSPGASAIANCGAYALRGDTSAFNFRESTIYLANFTPANPTYATGCGTGNVTYEKTTIITFENFPGGFGLPDSDQASLTGDTLLGNVDSVPAGRLSIWMREETGPGNGRVEIVTNPVGDNTLVAVAFSEPATRPPGTLIQRNVRGGSGFQNQVAPFDDNRPLVLALPYEVSLGDLVAVGIGQQSAALSDLAVSAYGNVWTPGPVDATHSTLTVFYTIVTVLPAAGEVFEVTISGTPNVLTTVYQSLEAGIIGITPAPGFTLDSVDFAVFLSQSGAFPTVTPLSDQITGVPAGAHLEAWSIVAGVENGEITWNPLDGYALEEHQDFIQYIGESVNRYRVGAMAMFGKTAPSDGDYDASIEVTAEEGAGLGANILLMSVSFLSDITLACPVDGGSAVVGEPYAKSLVVTEGTPPYLFELI